MKIVTTDLTLDLKKTHKKVYPENEIKWLKYSQNPSMNPILVLFL